MGNAQLAHAAGDDIATHLLDLEQAIEVRGVQVTIHTAHDHLEAIGHPELRTIVKARDTYDTVGLDHRVIAGFAMGVDHHLAAAAAHGEIAPDDRDFDAARRLIW